MLLLLGVIAVAVGVKLALREKSRRRIAALLVAIAGLVFIAIGAPRGILLGKALGALAMPLGLLWLSMLTLAIAAWWKERYRDAAIVASLWLALGLAANPVLAELLSRSVEGRHAMARPLEQRPFDAIIVLGGGTASRPGGEAQLGASGDRVMLAARLYHRGATPLLVTSGAPIRGLSTHDSARASTRIWRELGVPPSAIVRVDGARTTSEEAVLHARLIRERGWRRVGLVSSAVHMRRALALFEEQHARVVPLPADVHTEPIEWHGLLSLIPSASAAQEIHGACWELLGHAVGR